MKRSFLIKYKNELSYKEIHKYLVDKFQKYNIQLLLTINISKEHIVLIALKKALYTRNQNFFQIKEIKPRVQLLSRP